MLHNLKYPTESEDFNLRGAISVDDQKLVEEEDRPSKQDTRHLQMAEDVANQLLHQLTAKEQREFMDAVHAIIVSHYKASLVELDKQSDALGKDLEVFTGGPMPRQG